MQLPQHSLGGPASVDQIRPICTVKHAADRAFRCTRADWWRTFERGQGVLGLGVVHLFSGGALVLSLCPLAQRVVHECLHHTHERVTVLPQNLCMRPEARPQHSYCSSIFTGRAEFVQTITVCQSHAVRVNSSVRMWVSLICKGEVVGLTCRVISQDLRKTPS